MLLLFISMTGLDRPRAGLSWRRLLPTAARTDSSMHGLLAHACGLLAIVRVLSWSSYENVPFPMALCVSTRCMAWMQLYYVEDNVFEG